MKHDIYVSDYVLEKDAVTYEEAIVVKRLEIGNHRNIIVKNMTLNVFL